MLFFSIRQDGQHPDFAVGLPTGYDRRIVFATLFQRNFINADRAQVLNLCPVDLGFHLAIEGPDHSIIPQIFP